MQSGLDGQNGLVMLGIMVCRNETIENWKIFLGDLKPLVDEDGVRICFISDKQKGILEGVDYHFPLDEHRYCFRYNVYDFRLLFPFFFLDHL